MFEIANEKDLVAFFNHYTSQVRATLVTRTPVRMNKRDTATKTINNPYTVIYKIQTIAVDIGANYQDKVNDARLLEGQLDKSFRSGERTWGESVNKAIVEKDEEFYLHVHEIAKAGDVRYQTITGEEIEYSAFAAFLPTYKPNAAQNLVDEVKPRSFKLRNVLSLNIDNKVRYIAR